MKTYGQYVAEDFEAHGNPFDFEDDGQITAKYPATEKQISFYERLCAERNIVINPPIYRDNIDGTRDVFIGKREISGKIDELLKTPRVAPVQKTATTGNKITEDGMYRNPDTGDIFKVQFAVHGSGKLYAKILVVLHDAIRSDTGKVLVPADVTFDYASGAIYRLRPEWRMSLEDAKAFGALYGTCCVCGRTLTKESSIEAGIGPVCAGRF